MVDALPLHEWVEQRLLPLATHAEEEQREVVLRRWRALDGDGALRVEQADHGRLPGGRVAAAGGAGTGEVRAGSTRETIAHRLSGQWTPTAECVHALVTADTRDADRSRPYPFYLAYPLEGELEALGDRARVAARMEVGRDPRAAHPARRRRHTSGRAAASW